RVRARYVREDSLTIGRKVGDAVLGLEQEHGHLGASHGSVGTVVAAPAARGDAGLCDRAYVRVELTVVDVPEATDEVPGHGEIRTRGAAGRGSGCDDPAVGGEGEGARLVADAVNAGGDGPCGAEALVRRAVCVEAGDGKFVAARVGAPGDDDLLIPCDRDRK